MAMEPKQMQWTDNLQIKLFDLSIAHEDLDAVFSVGIMDVVHCALAVEQTPRLFPFSGTAWGLSEWPTHELLEFVLVADVLQTMRNSHKEQLPA